MESIHCLTILLTFIGILSPLKAQSPSDSTNPAQSLDSLLQDYAYRAFTHPHTGVLYEGNVPSNISGIKIAVARFRTGSLRTRGVQHYKEFEIPVGIILQPYVERMALVYHNLGNWSSIYYPLPGYTYLTPVIGFLAYDAANLSASNLPELGLVASKSPISINFTEVSPLPSGLTAHCVWFDLDGLPEFRDLVSSNVCSTYRQGHFSIVVNSTVLAPAPAPSQGPSSGSSPRKAKKGKVWKIVGAVVVGFVALILLAFLVVRVRRYKQNRKVAKMERRSEVGEALQMTRVGNTQAPVASRTRTQPVLENEYMA